MRTKILLIAIGTRGDCEPFLGLAQLLQQKGKEVLLALPTQYCQLAAELHIPTFSLGEKFLNLMQSDAAQRIMNAGGMKLRDLKAYLTLWKKSQPIQSDLLVKQAKVINDFAPTCIIAHLKATYVIPYHITTGTPCILLATVPAVIHAFKGLASVGVNRNLGETLNRWSYQVANWGQVFAIRAAAKELFTQPFSIGQIKKALLHLPIAYNISPNLFPEQNQLPAHARMIGFWDSSKQQDYHPSKELLSFLEQHERPLLITLGSMINHNPAQTTQLFLDVLTQYQIPAIINTSAGGLVEPEEYASDLFHFVTSIPYDWVMPKVYGVIHHGGAGTTQNAIQYGCPSLVIAHTADQPMWDLIVQRLGVGPKGVPISCLSAEHISSQIQALYYQDEYKAKALLLAQAMQAEDKEKDFYSWIAPIFPMG